MPEIVVPRREGSYRVNCGCGAKTESTSVFNPEQLLDAHINDFCNQHSGAGHAGMLELWERGLWRQTPMRFSPLTEADIASAQRVGL